MTEHKYVYLADGRKVPRVCVDAIDEFEKIWIGASFPMARAGIACAVVEAFKKFEEEEAKNKKVTISKEALLNTEPDLISVITEEMRKRSNLISICRYEIIYLDETGDVLVCSIHGQNSRHHCNPTINYKNSQLPCLELDPWPVIKDDNEGNKNVH